MATRDPYTFDNESSIPPGIGDAIRGVIKGWDIVPGDAWRDHCTQDVDVILAGQHAHGLDATKTMRDSTFDATNGPITKVSHDLKNVYLKAAFPVEDTTKDVFFTGTVKYTIGGKEVSEDFATFYELQSAGPGQYKVKTMRIYIDTAALGQAMLELHKPS